MSEAKSRRVYALALSTVFLDLVGLGIIIPIQPFYAEEHGASPALVTLLGASYAAMQFLFVPIWGRLSDKVGRRRIILVSISASVLGHSLFALATTLPGLFGARMLAGFGNANIATCQAALADVSPPERRARAMGLVGAAIGVGFILGPAIGGFAGQWGHRVPIYIAAVCSALNWLLVLFLFPETHPPEARGSGGRIATVLSPASLREARAWPGVRRIMLLFGVMATAFAMMQQVIGLFIERVWVPHAVPLANELLTETHLAAQKEAVALTATLLVLYGIVMVVIQGGLIGRLVPRVGERRLVCTGLGIAALGLACIPFTSSSSFPMLLLPVTFVAIGSALAHPCLFSLVSQATPKTDQGRALGLTQSMSSLGRVIGPSAAGMLLEIRLFLPFAVSAVLMTVALAIAQGLPRKAAADGEALEAPS